MKLKNTFFILFYALILLGDSALAEMSDSEKRAFIESLAVPSTEKRVFYRWQSKERQDALLDADNPRKIKQTFETAMNTPLNERYGGSGVYIFEKPDHELATHFGNHIIQIEVEKGYPFLDLGNPGIRKVLEKKG